MRQWADFTAETDSRGAVTLVFKGPLLVSSIGNIDRRLRDVQETVTRLDISQIDQIDTVGAWIVWRVARDHGAQLMGASDRARRLVEAVSAPSRAEDEAAAGGGMLASVLERLGIVVSGWGAAFLGVIGFMGAMLVSAASLIRHPTRFRGKALVHQLELVGVNSLGIIGLMSFLIGIVIAQQGAVQLRQFGAEIYTINLTGRLSLRELGILMTSIMVAGRSGSAFAAQIGTMKLTEEVDAMRTIGVSPMEALVIPRVLAAMMMLPLLGFYSALVAIVGGAFLASVTLDIPFFTFLTRIQEVVPLHDLWVGLLKAPVFGLIIGLSGCYNGMQVKSNAEEVGLRTTQAVVAAIFMVIVLDAFFAVFFTEIGWG
jgi:phospholipid/cholesterol/gamma-HCH transport system permease protein